MGRRWRLKKKCDSDGNWTAPAVDEIPKLLNCTGDFKPISRYESLQDAFLHYAAMPWKWTKKSWKLWMYEDDLDKFFKTDEPDTNDFQLWKQHEKEKYEKNILRGTRNAAVQNFVGD